MTNENVDSWHFHVLSIFLKNSSHIVSIFVNRLLHCLTDDEQDGVLHLALFHAFPGFSEHPLLFFFPKLILFSKFGTPDEVMHRCHGIQQKDLFSAIYQRKDSKKLGLNALQKPSKIVLVV